MRGVIGAVLMAMSVGGTAADSARVHEMVAAGPARIEVIAEGAGPPLLLLPSRGRDSFDCDDVAAAIARQGFRVLRPQPRGIGASVGPMENLTLHDLAADTAAVIAAQNAGPAILVGHAYGNWVARMMAVDRPEMVRGVVLAAAAAKTYPAALSLIVTRVADMNAPEAERRRDLMTAFFAAGHDPSPWLGGWHEATSRSQRVAADRTRQDEWWAAGTAPMLDLQAGADPFRPAATRNELRDELGERVSVAVIPDTSHALLPEAPEAVADAIVGWARGLK